MGELSYTTLCKKYGRYNYVHKRTMWRLAIPVINSVIHKTKGGSFAHPVSTPLIQKRSFTHHTFFPKGGKKLSPNSETATQKAANHPIVGEKNPDGKTADMKGNLSHSQNLPKTLNREKGTDLTESLKEEPQFFHAFEKAIPVPVSDFVDGGILSVDGSTKEQKIKKATEHQLDEN